jgi:hypothetical protein
MGWIAPADGNTYLNTSQKLNNAQLVANHFIATGWTPNAISALCGNMSGESTLNPNLYEQGYNHSLSRGYGLVQWTPATKLMDWCNARGLDWSDGDAQLSRIDYEQLNGIQWIKKSSYPMTFNEFTQSTLDPQTLTEYFIWDYERPSSYYGNLSLPKRKEFAQTCFDTLDWSGNGTVITPPDDTSPGDPADPGAETPSPQTVKNKKIVSMLMTDTLNGWKW